MRDRLVMNRHAFPLEAGAARALRDVYRDQWPLLVHENASYRLYGMDDVLACRPARDPDLARELASTVHVGLNDAARYRRLEEIGNGLLLTALQHTWALEGFARWATRRDRAAPAPVLVHIDAHDDLQAPSVLRSDGGFAMPVGQRRFSLAELDSVTEAIERGFIGIGGFIVPFLHSVPVDCVVHLVPRSHAAEPRTTHLQLDWEETLYFGGFGERPCVRRTAAASPDAGGLPLTTSSRLEALDDLPSDRPILLDIDMDYFCNAYDDSVEGGPELPGEQEVVAEVTAITDGLLDRLRGARVELVTVALSPGFFPARFWSSTVPRVRALGAELLLNAPPRA